MNNLSLTIREIERQNGLWLENTPQTSALEIWYASIRDKTLAELTVNDICIACRQNIFPEYVVPLAISHLQRDVRTGSKYDGEMLIALKTIPIAYWAKERDQANSVRCVLNNLRNAAGDFAETIAMFNLADSIADLSSKLSR